MKKEKELVLNLLSYTSDKNTIDKIKKIASIFDEKDYIVVDKEKFLAIIDSKKVVGDADIDDVAV
ncbi:hypothetical protein N9W84_00260 [bacterium]|nr:hypothetical protein [bacterium]